MQKHIKTQDYFEEVGSCSRYEFFTFDYTDTCKDIQSLLTNLS